MSTTDNFELPEADIAGQAGRTLHPFEAGKAAARRGEPITASPFVRGSSQHKRFTEGYHSEHAAMKQAGELPRADDANDNQNDNQKPEGEKMARTNKGGNAIQEELDIPGDPNVKQSKTAKFAAKHYAEAIIARVAASDDETKARKACEQVMLAEGLEVLPLPNGGSLVKETVSETTFHYEAPKKKKAKKGETNE